MTPRDLSEIKRRLDPSKRLPSEICGCYVGDGGEILASFRKSVALLPQEELDRYMAIFRKVLTGTQGQQIQPVSFSATEPEPAFDLFYRLRDSRLKDNELLNQLYGSVMAAIQEENAARPQSMDADKHAASTLILTLGDAFDLHRRRRDGEYDRENSESMYTYFLCCVCPVKPRKPELAYRSGDFALTEESLEVGMPLQGFLYPAREQGGADIYTAMYYTGSAGKVNETFVTRVFGTEHVPMPGGEQQEALCAMLQETLAEECSMEVMQAVHDRVSDMIQEQKEDRQADPLTLSGPDVTRMLSDCGVSSEKAEAFSEEFDEVFGPAAEVPAVNLVTPNRFRIDTPSVSIRVDPAHKDLVSTRVIDGQRCIVILADGAVEVNGVNIALSDG